MLVRIATFVFATVAVLTALAVLVVRQPADARSDAPWEHVPASLPGADHAQLVQGPFDDGPSVTRACLACHPEAAKHVMATSHWTWAGQEVEGPDGRIVQVGKKNLINNFCIVAGPNIGKCASCHAGYGWHDNSFDFSNQDNVDCLICHDGTGSYRKDVAGHPAEGVDLTAVAQGVGRPTRANCGQCHFAGGGGDAVKHGDMDGSMVFPSERIDVHMGRLDFQCVDCHQTRDHAIPGRVMPIRFDATTRVECTDCHSESPHDDRRLDSHTETIACQTCHIPRMAIDAATKMHWDWSAAGQDLPEDPHTYLKKKGRFQYAQDIRPEYAWYNGRAERYLTGQRIDPTGVVQINGPLGGPDDPQAKIWPFKVHQGRQIYDAEHLHLLTPRTWGPSGYWQEFDWDLACRLGSESTGLPYSGTYDFVDTEMSWPLSHMVQPAEKALRCDECHGESGMMNWNELGFDGDPMVGVEGGAE